MAWNAPRYFIAFAVHLGCYTLLVFTIVFLRFWLVRQNKKKDAAAAELLAAGVIADTDEAKMAHAFDDLTDRENPNFRYVY